MGNPGRMFIRSGSDDKDLMIKKRDCQYSPDGKKGSGRYKQIVPVGTASNISITVVGDKTGKPLSKFRFYQAPLQKKIKHKNI